MIDARDIRAMVAECAGPEVEAAVLDSDIPAIGFRLPEGQWMLSLLWGMRRVDALVPVARLQAPRGEFLSRWIRPAVHALQFDARTDYEMRHGSLRSIMPRAPAWQWDLNSCG